MVFLIISAFILMACFYLAYQRVKVTPGHSRALAVTLKCAATSMAVLTALLGCLQHGTAARWVLLAGLTVAVMLLVCVAPALANCICILSVVQS